MSRLHWIALGVLVLMLALLPFVPRGNGDDGTIRTTSDSGRTTSRTTPLTAGYGEVTPVFWVWQKLLFVFGGLLMPIELYPALVRDVAPFTPFPSVLSRPASLVLHSGAGESIALVLSLAGWGVITSIVLTLLFRRATGALTVNGG